MGLHLHALLHKKMRNIQILTSHLSIKVGKASQLRTTSLNTCQLLTAKPTKRVNVTLPSCAFQRGVGAEKVAGVPWEHHASGARGPARHDTPDLPV